MNSILYTYDKKDFDSTVQAHVEKLTFNTREEYLLWVQQWKEDYKHILYLRKIEKLGRFTLPDKIKNAEKQIAIIESKFDRVKAKKIAVELQDKISKEYGLKFYWPLTTYSLIMYLLVARKASKIRAGKKREERIAVEKATAV
jgi:hypothetical protein